MGKTTSKITDTLVSIAKAAPLILGASGGMIVPATGGVSPAKALIDGNAGAAYESALANYTFYSANSGGFRINQGNGIKILAVGVIAHKIIGAIADA